MNKNFDFGLWFESTTRENLFWFNSYRVALLTFLVAAIIVTAVKYQLDWPNDDKNWYLLRNLLVLAIIVIAVILAFFTIDERKLARQQRAHTSLIRVLTKHLNSLPEESVEVQNKSLTFFIAETQGDVELIEAYQYVLEPKTKALIGKYCREQIKIEMQESVVNANANLAGHIKSDVAAAVLQRHAAKILVLNAIATTSSKNA